MWVILTNYVDDLAIPYLFSLLTHIVKSLDVGRTLQNAFSIFISIVAKKIQIYWYLHVTLFEMDVNECGVHGGLGLGQKNGIICLSSMVAMEAKRTWINMGFRVLLQQACESWAININL